MMRKLYLAGVLATATFASAALAGDTPFTPDAAATWSARSLLLAKVYDDAVAGTLSKRSFGVACDGITGEQMKHEYGKEPRWALGAQAYVCIAYDGYAGKFRGSKFPCRDLKRGREELANAAQPGTPQDVADAAATLTRTIDAILEATEGGKKGCKL